MTAVAVQLAEALRASLAGLELSQAFEVQRAYAPSFKPEELITARVTIIPAATEVGRASRTARSHDVAIDVGVQRRVDEKDVAVVDAMLLLAEEIIAGVPEQLLDHPLLSLEHDPVVVPDHLLEHSVFTSVITATYSAQVAS